MRPFDAAGARRYAREAQEDSAFALDLSVVQRPGYLNLPVLQRFGFECMTRSGLQFPSSSICASFIRTRNHVGTAAADIVALICPIHAPTADPICAPDLSLATTAM